MMNRGGGGGGGGDELVRLPPGFRFHPTNEEIITHYLIKKVIDSNFVAAAIGEADLNKCEPWDLPKQAKMGEKEWYFFCQKDRKYPTGTRTNRATVSGYWKATGKDKEIRRGKNCLVGMKKTLVFYLGRAPKGGRTNWVMHEYRLEGKFPVYGLHKVSKDEWVVCRVLDKSIDIKNPNTISGMPRMNSIEEEFSIGSLPPLVDPSYSGGPGSSFTDGESELKVGTNIVTRSNPSVMNPNNIANNINYLSPSSYRMNPSSNQPLFHPPVQTNTNVFRAQGRTNPSYYFPQLGNMNIAQCKLEPYQSRSMISRQEYTGLNTDLNPEISSSNMKQEPLSGIVPQFEDVLGPFISPPDSDNLLGFSWDY